MLDAKGRYGLVALALLAVLGLALWLRSSSEESAPQAPSPPSSREPRPEQPRSEPAAATPPEAPLPPTSNRPPSVPPEHSTLAERGSPPAPETTLPELRIVGPGPDDAHEPGMVPHPLDEKRERIQAENRLLQALNDAMSHRDVHTMRKLLDEYRKLDPDDVDAYQYGYEVIADCIEFPGDASLAAARKFYETERHSSLRRFVRRICFEKQGG